MNNEKTSRISRAPGTEKDRVIERLKKQGFRITKQRKLLIDIILSETCSCCKEVYVLASKKDSGIGMATVYRTVDALEKAGALKRSSSYQLCSQNRKSCQTFLVELDYASVEKFIEAGLLKSGLSSGKKVRRITLSAER